jgi:hypothetical protein
MKALISKLLISITVGAAMLFSSAASAQQISLVSANYSNTGSADGESDMFNDGYRHAVNNRYVGFVSYARDIVTGNPYFATLQLYVRDLQSNTTEIITKNYQTGAPSNWTAGAFEFSADGRYLAFLSMATDLVPGTPNVEPRLFLRNMQTGTLAVVQMAVPGPPVSGQLTRFSLSNDGKKLAFASRGWNQGFLTTVIMWKMFTFTTPIPARRL